MPRIYEASSNATPQRGGKGLGEGARILGLFFQGPDFIFDFSDDLRQILLYRLITDPYQRTAIRSQDSFTFLVCTTLLSMNPPIDFNHQP